MLVLIKCSDTGFMRVCGCHLVIINELLATSMRKGRWLSSEEYEQLLAVQAQQETERTERRKERRVKERREAAMVREQGRDTHSGHTATTGLWLLEVGLIVNTDARGRSGFKAVVQFGHGSFNGSLTWAP